MRKTNFIEINSGNEDISVTESAKCIVVDDTANGRKVVLHCNIDTLIVRGMSNDDDGTLDKVYIMGHVKNLICIDAVIFVYGKVDNVRTFDTYDCHSSLYRMEGGVLGASTLKSHYYTIHLWDNGKCINATGFYDRKRSNMRVSSLREDDEGEPFSSYEDRLIKAVEREALRIQNNAKLT